MTEIALRFDHRDKKGCACYGPIDYSPVHRDPARGQSLLVTRTLVSEYFRGMDPKNTRAALILGDVSAGRAGVGE